MYGMTAPPSAFRVKATGESATGQGIDRDGVLHALSLLATPGEGVQLQALPSGRCQVFAASDADAMLRWVDANAHETPIESRGAGTYYSLNPVRADLQLEPGKGIKVGDVVWRRRLLFDLDTIRPKDTSASEAEKEESRVLAEKMVGALTEREWPAPAVIDSGNGWHLVYAIDLPNTKHSQALTKAVLAAAGKEFNTDRVKVDPALHNANRIAKLPGTWARKGPNTPDRPWRMARLVFAPEKLEAVPLHLLMELAGTPAEQQPAPPVNGHASPFGVKASAESDGGLRYARKALDGWCAQLATAIEGPEEGRNNTLNKAAFRMGRFVAGGCIGRQEVEGRLLEIAVLRGLSQQEAERTIRSGMDAGMLEPLTPPEKKAGPQPSKPAADAVPAGERVTYRASTVTPKPIRWLWPWRIPLGKLTTFAGRGGLGKTFVLCDISARTTTGLPWPDGGGECREPGDVLFISGEDDVDDTLVPRLIECGADLSRVSFLKNEVQGKFVIGDLATLDRAVAEMRDVRLIVVDPPTSFVGDVDDHKNSEVRSITTPLSLWAARRGLSVVFNTHFNKASGAKIDAIERVIGSVAWVNASRAACIFAEDPDDDTHERRLFIPSKTNIAKRMKGLAYRIAERPNDLAVVEWLGEVDTTANEAVNKEGKKQRRDVVASEWLIERFRERLEWESEDLFTRAKNENISRSAVFDAKAKLNLPRARRQVQENGDITYLWWVAPDWPPLRPEKRTSKPVEPEDESFQ
jgi:hypothetical protein